MEIARLGEDKALLGLYDDYVNNRPECMLYYSIKYKDFISSVTKSETEYLCAVQGGAIVGILPLMYRESRGRRVYNSLPFYGSHGGIISDDTEAIRFLSDEYHRIASSSSTIAATIIANPFLIEAKAQIVGSHYDSRIGQITPISARTLQGKQMIDIFEGRARTSIRRAKNQGVVVESDPSQLSKLYEMHCVNMKRIGANLKPESFFTKIPQYFKTGEDYQIYLAKQDGEVIAGLLVFFFNGTAEYFVPAVLPEYRSYQPMAAILHLALIEAAGRGCDFWNWGGTWLSQENVYRFKKQWGARDYTYQYTTLLNDSTVLDSSSGSLQKEFPFYYIIPYEALKLYSSPMAEGNSLRKWKKA